MRIILLLIVINFSALQLFAGVNLKNGNFYVTYTDIELKDSLWQDLQIKRTYNSRAIYSGPLGYGWGYLFDTHLIILPDFSAIVKNNGSGARSEFDSELTNTESIQKYINLIVDAAYKSGRINTPEEEIELNNQLLSNAELRLAYFEIYRKSGLIEQSMHQADMTFFSKGCGCIGENKPGFNYMVSTMQGYVYYDYRDDQIFTFNKEGKMISLSSLENPDWFWSISYDDHNYIEKITSYNGDQLLFKTDSLGRVIEIASGKTPHKVFYSYSNSNLSKASDQDGTQFNHEYDKLHNMTKIVYNPNRQEGDAEDAKKMIYGTGTGGITKFIDRDGSYIKYNYPEISENEYGTQVLEYTNANVLLKETAEYFVFKFNEQGNRWTYKTTSIVNADTTIRIFHEITRKPVSVVMDGETFEYVYSAKGLLLYANTSSLGSVVINYEGDNNMVSLDWNEEQFNLVMESGEYTKLILPNNKAIELPIQDFNDEKLSTYKQPLEKIKKLFDLGYYDIL